MQMTFWQAVKIGLGVTIGALLATPVVALFIMVFGSVLASMVRAFL